jgi:serine/threonine-protein kinase
MGPDEGNDPDEGAGDDSDATINDRPRVAARAPEATTVLPSRAAGTGTAAPPAPEVRSTTSTSGTSTTSATSGAGRSLATGPTSIGSPLEALHHAEILGTRQFCKITIAIAFAGAAAVALLPGHPVSSTVFVAAIVAAVIALLYLYARTKDPSTFAQGSGVAISWYVPALAVSAAVPFFGPFSPVAVVLVLGIYFTSLGRSTRLAATIYLTCAITQGLTGTLVILEKIDPGFVPVDTMPLRVQVLCQLLVQVVLLGTFLIARAHRRSSLTALGALERAVRAVAQREALLDEAREELRRAMGAGRGRFSEQVLGRYRLGDVIGRGAMGEVYEAADTASGELVAIKMLSSTSLGDANHVQRFLRELRTAAAISSPHVVRVIEVGEQPLPHLVMERLRGKDLATILRGSKTLSHNKVVDLIRQAGAGIAAAAAVGIVHRDLKPQNLFLVGTTWKVLDFGVARMQGGSDTLTQGQIVGTPAYMAPEQARGGGTVDHRADLYALAAIAYRVLTGHTPFGGGEVVDVLYRVVHGAPRRPSTLANLPEDIDLALAIGLAKNPTDRFTSATELAGALEAALAGTLSESLRARGRVLVAGKAWATPITAMRLTP